MLSRNLAEVYGSGHHNRCDMTKTDIVVNNIHCYSQCEVSS